jgi:hypothetical protein
MEDARARYLELLHDASHREPLLATVTKFEARHEGGAVVGEQELVQVRRPSLPRREARDLPVRRVRDDVLPAPEPTARKRLPPREHRLAAEHRRAEVHRRARRGGAEPHHLSSIVEDEHAALPGAGRRREEEESGRRVHRGMEHAHCRRREIGPRAEARRNDARRNERESGAAGEELGPREGRQRPDEIAATGAFGGGCAGGFESVRIAAASSTAIATALSPTSVRPSKPTTPSRWMRGTAMKW